MAQPLKVLIVEDRSEDAELMLRELARAGINVSFQRVDNEADFLEALDPTIQLVLSDYRMPRFNGLRALELLKERSLDIPFILVSGTIGEETAVDAVKVGASDYLLKDRLARLGDAVKQALESTRLRAERRRLDEALRVSEQRFRTTLDNLAEGCQIIARDWKYIYVNRAAANQGRRSPAELVGKTVLEAFPTMEATPMFATLRQCMDDGGHRKVESEFIYPDGGSRWFEYSVQGVPEGLFITSVDTTERRRSAEALAQSERRFREMLEQVDLLAVTLDSEGIVQFVNQRILALTGIPREQLIGQDWFASGVPESAASNKSKFLESIRVGQVSAHHETSIRTGTGEVRQVRWSNTILHDAHGDILGIASIGEDVTARRAAEEALRVSEERFRQVVENIHEVFWMTTVDKAEILYLSPGYEAIWGRPCESAYHSAASWADSIHPADRTRIVMLASAPETAGHYDEIYRILRPDGSIRWIHDKAFPITDADGVVRRIVGVAEDITDQKLLESQFLRAQRLEAIGTLSTGIAHDLNNILAPTMMVVSLLRDKLSDAADLELLGMVEQGAQRGANIIKQLLTFSRGIEGDRGSVQVRHLLREMAALMRETFPKDIQIVDTTPSDLPLVIADATQLSQVLMNLCVNARDSMPSGGKLVVSAFTTALTPADLILYPHAKAGPYVALSVCDTGAGIAPELRDRIFEPFFTTKEVGKGTGLGLSTVMGIAKSHGGFVTVASEESRGSTFTVYLPATETIESVSQAASSTRSGRGQLVLIVDDEAPIRKAIAQTLGRLEYRVLMAADGREALELFLQNRSSVRLVITDVMMPNMSGIGLIRAIRQLEPKQRIVAMSGLNDETQQAQLGELNITSVLPKPCSAAELLDVVRQALERAREPDSRT